MALRKFEKNENHNTLPLLFKDLIIKTSPPTSYNFKYDIALNYNFGFNNIALI